MTPKNARKVIKKIWVIGECQSKQSLSDCLTPGADPEIWKRGVALCLPPWLAEENCFRFQMDEKGENNVRHLTSWRNISISIFEFSPMRKEILRKVELCFIAGCFIKPF